MSANEQRQINSNAGIVATQYEEVSRAGTRMLEAGGNAVDAACASGFAYCVVSPGYTGVAGYGGAMVIHLADTGETISLDFNGEAPGAAHEHMYLTEPTDARIGVNAAEYHCEVKGNVNVIGPLSINVPGIVSGLAKAHSLYGKLPWRDIIAPSIELAEKGFTAPRILVNHIKHVMEQRPEFTELIRLWAPDGVAPKEGQIVRCPELARTLKVVAEEGAEVFYSGWIGKRIAQYVQEQGGIVTEADMAGYETRVENPLRTTYRGYEILTPHLAIGGLTVLQMLKILENFDLSDLSPTHPEYLRLFTEAARTAWKDRLEFFGDHLFVPVDEEKFMSEEYTRQQAEWIRNNKPEPPQQDDPSINTCTVHLGVVDRDHNLVSCTHTHGGTFGAMTTVPELGITMSHGMCRFDPRPGLANSIAPKKRMLNNMAPVIILKDDKPYASLGAPGGRTIISTVTHLVVALIDFKYSIGNVMAAPRFHTINDTPVGLNDQYPQESIKALEEMGYPVKMTAACGGKSQGVVVNPDGSHSAANPSECEFIPITERKI